MFQMSVFASKARNVAFLLSESKFACSTRWCSSNNSTSSSGLRGVFSPITTPFHEDESIAWPNLKANLNRWNEVKGLRGYLVQGSNGEYCYLNSEERVAMIDKVRQWAANDKLVLAGSGCESTKDTIEMTLAMAKAGVFFFQKCKLFSKNGTVASSDPQCADGEPSKIVYFKKNCYSMKV